jgi:ribosomal protein S18 acetylase RimI-like enzyme
MRDLAGVTALIEQAFADDMDPRGRSHMREMRWLATLFGWMDWFAAPGQGFMPGYVWLEQGRIVGNVTVRKLSMFGPGWMIGNVAVSPEWRGRGIGRHLVEASIELVRHNRGSWIALQVRTDNAIAHTLYQKLGFVDTGELVTYEASQLERGARPQPPVGYRLRAAHPGDMDQIFALAQSFVPDSVRWAEPVYRSQFDVSVERGLSDWLTGGRHVWRVIETAEQLCGSALLELKGRPRSARLQFWVQPARAGSIEDVLLDSVLAELNQPLDLVVARVPGEHIAGRVALTTRGFRQVRALTSMKLIL